MSVLFDRLPLRDRRFLSALAQHAGTDTDALGAAMIAGYLRLLRDAEAALPEKALSQIVRESRKLGGVAT
jgi:hypothetical protein